MASRFGPSALHQRDPRSSLFENYTGDKKSRPSSHSPARPNGSYGYSGSSGSVPVNDGFRPATPNRKGQYSDAVLSELESQNDDQVEGMSARVKMLKDITIAIGDEIRDSSKLADKMNDSFDNTRVRLKGTMNRMLRMAERTGVGWRVWLGFFAAVILLFWYVWLF
ncbi:protein transport protein bet1 [Xylographa parallela]|nr:protein transport protein bet1 [Xylographa parallela]